MISQQRYLNNKVNGFEHLDRDRGRDRDRVVSWGSCNDQSDDLVCYSEATMLILFLSCQL